MHPLSPDLTQLTDDELHRKHADIIQRITFAYRMGHTQMIQQLQMLLEDYNYEIQKRNQKMLEEVAKSGRNYQDKINIGK